LNYSNHNRLIAGNFDRVTNPYPHPNPTDFAHEIRIRWMWMLAGSVTCLDHSDNFLHGCQLWTKKCNH